MTQQFLSRPVESGKPELLGILEEDHVWEVLINQRYLLPPDHSCLSAINNPLSAMRHGLFAIITITLPHHFL
jgi:hypothetical protein